MKICDRTFARDGATVVATHEIKIGEEVFHLCESEMTAVREYVIEPKKWKTPLTISDGTRQQVRKADTARTTLGKTQEQ